MPLFGVDIHPQFQAGISIEQIAREGFGFISTKLSQGTNTGYTTTGSADWVRRAHAVGMVTLGYHYLEAGSINAQAKAFAGALKLCGDIPGVLDAEALAADKKTPTLNIQMIREFYSLATAYGARIPLLYLPRWYWERIGSPNLNGLPLLWASSYPTNRALPPAAIYSLVGPTRWSTYGGGVVGVLQFGETGMVAGRVIDVNAFLGTQASFAGLVGASVPRTRRRSAPMSYAIAPTAVPLMSGDKPPGPGWEAVEHVVSAPGPAGGWSGRIVMHFTPGYGGAWIEEAWSGPQSGGKHYVERFDDRASKGGFYAPAFVPISWELPTGDRFLTLRLATRAHIDVTPETER